MSNKLDHAEDVIKNYLQDSTNFALLISGRWGSGKTYFYENKIVPLAKTIQLPGSPLYFLPIRISLFGINSIDELESEVLATLYPLIKDSVLQAGASVVKALTKGIVKKKFDVNIDDFIPNLKVDKKSLAAKEHLLLCFDDLERRGKGIDVGQIIGYINSLVENNNAKVIILANEDQIEGGDYKFFKEKTIGISLEFKQDVAAIYSSFIQEKYSLANQDYYQFLNSNQSSLLAILSYADSNLRIILDAISRTEKVFNAAQKINLEKIVDAVENVVRFSLGIHIEFKSGTLNQDAAVILQKGVLGFSAINWKAVSGNPSQQNEEEEKDYLTIFREKYFSLDRPYHFYEAVYSYLVKYSSLDNSSLWADLATYFPNPSNEPEAVRVFRLLSSTAFGDLSAQEYLRFTSSLIKHAQQGAYGPVDTISTFYFATRLDNPLRLNKRMLADKLIQGLKAFHSEIKSVPFKRLYLYNSMLEMQLAIPADHPEYTEMQRMAQVALKLNKQLRQKQQNDFSESLANAFRLNPSEFLERLKEDRVHDGAVFGAIKPREFVSGIKNRFSYNQILTLTQFFKASHYHSSEKDSQEDIDFLSHSVSLLEGLSHKGLNFQQKATLPELIKIIHRRISQGFRELIAD